MLRLDKIIVLAAVLGIWIAIPARGQTPTGRDNTVLILQSVKTNYADPNVSRNAVAKAAPAQTTVKPQEGLSSVISRLYSVGPSNAPAAYAQIADAIRGLNNLSAKSELISGQSLTVPDLPKIAKTQPSSSNPFNDIPKLSFDIRPASEVAAPINLDTDQKVEDSQRLGADSSVLLTKMTPNDARVTLANDPTAIVAEAPLYLHFLQAQSGGGAQKLLTAAETTLIGAAVARPRRQQPVMIVFDDTWPDQASEEAARPYILKAVQTLRSKYNLPPMAAFDVNCRQGVAVSAWPNPAGTIHAAQIKQSLKPLTDAAGPNSPVSVIFLPALAGGPCVSEVLGQLIELHLLTLHLGPQLGRGVPAALVSNYHQVTQSVVSKLRTQIDAEGGDSDVEIISAVLDFARRYGGAIKQPVFVSMSWEFKFDNWQPLVPSEVGGLFVVAAGNDGTSAPVTTTKSQFAARSVHPGDMLAVMNVDEADHFTCETSLVDPTGTAFATSYNGWLSDMACGTSFSAPRVAWLLALREATRAPLPDPTDLPTNIRDELKASGESAVSVDGAKSLDISILLH